VENLSIVTEDIPGVGGYIEKLNEELLKTAETTIKIHMAPPSSLKD